MPDPASATEAAEPSPFSIDHPIFRLQARLVDCSLEVGWRLKQGTDAEGLAQWQQRRADAWDKLDREIEDYAQQAHAAGVAEGIERAAKGGVGMIATERERQMAKEGWTAEHDDSHRHSELAQAAACYAWPPPRDAAVKLAWPWDKTCWKPEANHWPDLLPSQEDRTKARIKVLAKAGALIAAEIDRLSRALGRDQEGKA